MIGQRAVDRELGKTPRDVATFTGSAMTAPGTLRKTSAPQQFRQLSRGTTAVRAQASRDPSPRISCPKLA
jgi:hypothetical protein